jgi:folate-binding protein YgfZ
MNLEAYNKAHSTLAVLDASAITGRIKASGADALDLLHRMSTNDLRPLFTTPGSGAQTILTTEKARIIDLITVIAEENGALLVTSNDHEATVINWLDKFVIMEDAKFTTVTASISHILVFGPRALEYLTSATSIDLISIEKFQSKEVQIASIPVKIQRSNRIIESGFSIYCSSDDREALLAIMQEQIADFGGAIIDEDTYETIRIEAGMPKAPNELNDSRNPLEASLVQAVSFTKGCYTGQEVIARLDTYDKVQRHLMGIRTDGEVSLTTPAALSVADGTEIGQITSFTYSPGMNASIGMAFIKTAFANNNSSVLIGDSKIAATLTNLPFDIES